jgi:hypothetical protein
VFALVCSWTSVQLQSHISNWKMEVRNSCTRLDGSYFTTLFLVTRLYSVDERLLSDWRRIGKDLKGSGSGLILRYYPGISMEGLRKTTKNLSQDSRSPGPRFDPGTSRTRSRRVNHSTTNFELGLQHLVTSKCYWNPWEEEITLHT